MNKTPPFSFVLLICLMGAAYYFYETILETVPSTIVDPLMASFHINATKAGVLDSCYFITYAIMQIPGGALLDKFGARRVMPVAALMCFIGLSLFAATDYYSLAALGRIIAGLGGTFGLMGAMFIVASWIDSRFLAFALGLTIMVGLSGGLLENPLVDVVADIGWRHTIGFLGLIALMFTFLFAIIIRDNPHRVRSQQNFIADIINVISRWRNWPVAVFGGLMYISTGTLGSMWGINFFKAYYPHLTASTAATINSMIFLGWIIGSPVAGWLSDLIKRRKVLLVISSLLCVIILLTITYRTSLSIRWMFILFFALGFFTSFSGLTFAMGCELNSKTTGAAIGFVNMLAIIPSIIITPLFGLVLDHYWQGTMSAGARIFSQTAYQRAMILEYVVVIIALLIAVLLIKESYPTKRGETKTFSSAAK